MRGPKSYHHLGTFVHKNSSYYHLTHFCIRPHASLQRLDHRDADLFTWKLQKVCFAMYCRGSSYGFGKGPNGIQFQGISGCQMRVAESVMNVRSHSASSIGDTIAESVVASSVQNVHKTQCLLLISIQVFLMKDVMFECVTFALS